MKTVILHNANISDLSCTDELYYLAGARVTAAMTHNSGRNTVFMMWDDRKWDNERQTYDENLCPRPVNRIFDFINNIWEGSDEEREHLLNNIKTMNSGAKIHYDMVNFEYLA